MRRKKRLQSSVDDNQGKRNLSKEVGKLRVRVRGNWGSRPPSNQGTTQSQKKTTCCLLSSSRGGTRSEYGPPTFTLWFIPTKRGNRGWFSTTDPLSYRGTIERPIHIERHRETIVFSPLLLLEYRTWKWWNKGEEPRDTPQLSRGGNRGDRDEGVPTFLLNHLGSHDRDGRWQTNRRRRQSYLLVGDYCYRSVPYILIGGQLVGHLLKFNVRWTNPLVPFPPSHPPLLNLLLIH